MKSLAGTVGYGERREMDALVEAAHPEWFCWFWEQGLFSLYEVKKQLEFFGSKILPQYQ